MKATEVAKRVNAQMKSEVLGFGSDERFSIKRAPTGILTIDRMLGGGFARGRHHEMYGDFAAGKSYILYCTLARAQERGEVCAIIDGEHTFNEDWFRQLGGDPDSLIGYWPRTANELAKVLQLFVHDDSAVKGVDIVGIDSVASLVTMEEMGHDFEEGDARVASLARLMSALLRRVTAQNDDTVFIWTNQWRDKIGRIPGQKTTPGGLALSFYASTRIELMMGERQVEDMDVPRGGTIGKRKVATGQWVNCQLTKDKTGARARVPYSFMFDFNTRQIDKGREILDLSLRDGIIRRAGDHFEIWLDRDDAGKPPRVHGIKRTLSMLENEELRGRHVDWIEARTELEGES
jgi:recombination protein RecA